MPLTPAPTLPDSFGPALRFLRKRARLTQEELGSAVGYGREQIARLENGSRLPDLAAIAALFVPVLLPEQERDLVEQFLALAGRTRQNQQITITRTKETRVQLIQETIVTPTHRPPSPLLPLIGRQAELQQLLNQLPTTRLLTLIGAPGIGKTRLALELAHAILGQFADGVVFVPLAEAQTAVDIPYLVLRHLDLTPSPQQTVNEAIMNYLVPRHLLLVLDNCEHLLGGVTLFTDWLAGAPSLKLLCTSRVPLDLYGEQEWPLSPLAIPNLAEHSSLHWGDYPAMQLLLARAQAIDPAFGLNEENLLPLAALCAALDGLPLALELAAGRLREYDPATLVQQLLLQRGHQQLSSTWLQQTRRNVAERHRTLQAAIRWSVCLLPTDLQEIFHQLGVFSGGGTETAALSVAQADPALLTQLARANLIQLGNGRFSLLETLRAYAGEQLAAADRLSATQQAHAHYFAQFAQELFTGLLGEEQSRWMQLGMADQDNCLAALRWALGERDGETAVAIASGLWWFWYRRGLFALGREMLTAALELPSTNLTIRAVALNGLASYCLVDDDYAANLAYHEEGLALRRQLNDTVGVATVLHNLGLTAFTMGDYPQATRWLEESITTNPSGNHTAAWAHLGLLAQETDQLAQARHWLEMAYHSTPAGWSQAFVMNYLADVLRELDELPEAARLAQESVRLFTELDDRYYLPDAQLTLAQIMLQTGEHETAVALIALVYEQYTARDDPAATASVLLIQAELASKMGAKEEAAALLEEARTLRQRVQRAISPHEQAQYDRVAQATSMTA